MNFIFGLFCMSEMFTNVLNTSPKIIEKIFSVAQGRTSSPVYHQIKLPLVLGTAKTSWRIERLWASPHQMQAALSAVSCTCCPAVLSAVTREVLKPLEIYFITRCRMHYCSSWQIGPWNCWKNSCSRCPKCKACSTGSSSCCQE